MNYSPALRFECQDYKELSSIDEAFPLVLDLPTSWCFQLKYDGIWAQVVIEGEQVRIFSKTGQEKIRFNLGQKLLGLDKGPTILIAEYMFGSQWAQDPNRRGKIFVFDCVMVNGNDVSTLTYGQRERNVETIVAQIADERFQRVRSYFVSNLGAIWQELCQQENYEGIVLRKLSATYFTTLYKLKREVEDDFVVMNTYEGTGKYEGMLGGITLGKYKNGELVEVMKVGGGFDDDQRAALWYRRAHILGTVCKVKGKSRFESGALRHPVFVQFRDDKLAKDCVLK